MANKNSRLAVIFIVEYVLIAVFALVTGVALGKSPIIAGLLSGGIAYICLSILVKVYKDKLK